MEKKKFNPLEWMNAPQQQPQNGKSDEPATPESLKQVELVIRQIEDQQLDITSAYSNWRNIGFALADEFGEEGRPLFHRISRFYSDYSESECNLQFTKCLKAKGQGISLNTFFYHAKNAGIKLPTSNPAPETENDAMPTFPEPVFQALPEFL